MVDLTVAAIPFYFATMGAEAAWHRRNRGAGTPSPGDYERNDTLTSLAMGVGSLLVPYATRPLMKRFEVGRGRWARPALVISAAAALGAVAADAVARSRELEAGELPAGSTTSVGEPASPGATHGRGGTPAVGSTEEPAHRRRAARPARIRTTARRLGGAAAATAIAGAGAVVAGTWANRTVAQRLWRRRVLPDWGTGALPTIAAVFAWDAIYYWNHRLQHEVRYLWAIHVVHHSSEHYNLSTALRQPVAESFGTFVPYGLMSLLGIRPSVIETARAVNLIYQYWIHTEVIRGLGPLEKVLNTPSHHRVHHGSNRQYLDRNHGSILIVWDKLFGTFEAEREPVRYGLTRNINTFNLLRVAGHEYTDIAADVTTAQDWSDRIGYVVRGPGWAYERREARGLDQPPGAEAPHGEGDDRPPDRQRGQSSEQHRDDRITTSGAVGALGI